MSDKPLRHPGMVLWTAINVFITAGIIWEAWMVANSPVLPIATSPPGGYSLEIRVNHKDSLTDQEAELLRKVLDKSMLEYRLVPKKTDPTSVLP